ncbi:hypothetical protein BDV28DRAFT_151634 [Aspergillus coremiiformis]|uniref:Rhodopsin domain-containing protein n=1 Tax=Aspergillus coremiiformis TaxID=138285 RepID=A0A5N6YW68_9EURO|nr:hypothetical protein BDV28DRAFT_151634 [Aspergillus coremiiformis]
MSPEDRAGRIHKNAFTISTSFFFGLAVLGVLMRFFIRFRVRKERFATDDGLLLVAFAFLIASMVIMYHNVIDRMYIVYALLINVEGAVPPTDWRDISSQFHLWSSICLTLIWLSFSAVKLSFLFFFKKLIDRMHSWLIYWWVITIFNGAVLLYGSTIYFISCPYFFDDRELQCSTGYRKHIIVTESVVLMVMDTVGDVLILAIPFSIIWKIRVRLPHKIILMCSLCLTIVMIALSIIRVSGLVYHGAIDSIWQTYWQFLGSEIGVFLASAVAFRSFFMARNKSSTPVKYSIKKALKQSLSGANNRRHPDSFPDSWYEIPASELDSASRNGRVGPELRQEARSAQPNGAASTDIIFPGGRHPLFSSSRDTSKPLNQSQDDSAGVRTPPHYG